MTKLAVQVKSLGNRKKGTTSNKVDECSNKTVQIKFRTLHPARIE